MIDVRPASERGRTNWGWLDSRHTFSFGAYCDAAHMGFRALRVINDDRVLPGAGFGTHGHRDMEILSFVLEGALEHKDSSGGGGVIRPGEIQLMRAGRGIRHSEFNHSKDHPLHFLQIWIEPDRSGLPAAYAQKTFDRDRAARELVLLGSRDGREDSLQIQQDVDLWLASIGAGEGREFTVREGRHAWVHVARGSVALGDVELHEGDVELHEGDGASTAGRTSLRFLGRAPSEALVFDLA